MAEFARIFERTGDRFIRRIYTKAEIAYCQAQPHPLQSFAVRFAAKEASMKALGLAGQDGLSWRDFEVLSDNSGKPTLVLHRKAATTAKSLRLCVPLISLSHSRSAAGAVAIAEVVNSKMAKRTDIQPKRRRQGR